MFKSENKTVDLNILRTKKEKIYFRVALALSIPFWLWLLSPIGEFFIPNSTANFSGVGIAIGVLVVLQAITIFLHLISLAYIRVNALKVSTDQFPELYNITQDISKQLDLKRTPDIFIINSSGTLNAFATKLVFRRIIVVYSDLVDALTLKNDNGQVKAILTHELGHHALKHTDFWVNYLISPASIILPLDAALSRSREYSADRVMSKFTQNEEICSRALIKLATGGKIGQQANIEAYVLQIKEEQGFFSWLVETHSSHPFLPKRILALK